MRKLTEGFLNQGSESIAVVKDRDLIYRLEPTKLYQEITVENVLDEGTSIIDLSKYIDKDHEVVSYFMDIAFDDNFTKEEMEQAEDNEYGGKLILMPCRQGKPYQRVRMVIGAGRVQFRHFFLRPDETLKIYSTVALTSLTFVCEPVLLRQPIVAHSEV
ncbi:MAG: hypothetical protein AAFQ80_05490 [Cyanobacteria bacterium J06621_8]